MERTPLSTSQVLQGSSIPVKKKLSTKSSNFNYSDTAIFGKVENSFHVVMGRTHAESASQNQRIQQKQSSQQPPKLVKNEEGSQISAKDRYIRGVPNPPNAKPTSNPPKTSNSAKRDQDGQILQKNSKPLTKEDFPSLSGTGTYKNPLTDREWVPLPTNISKPTVTPVKQPQQPPKPPKKRNFIARLQLELIDIPVRVAKELEKNPTPASYAMQHNPAIRRTGVYQQRKQVQVDLTGAARVSQKKESKFQKIKQEYLATVRASLSNEGPMETPKDATQIDNAYLNKLAMGYSEEVKRYTEFVNSIKMRANYPVNIALREFIDNLLLPLELEKPLLSLVNKLSFRHQLKKRKTPLKAKKRLVSGLKEVIRAAKSNLPESLPKLVVIAVDLQRSPQEQGIDDAAHDLIDLLKNKNIPYVFAGTRAELGGALYGQVISSNKVKSACIALLDLQGYESEVKDLLITITNAKEGFAKLMQQQDFTL